MAITPLLGQVPGIQKKILAISAVALEVGLDLAAQEFDPAAAVGIFGQHIGFAAVVAGGPEDRDHILQGPAGHGFDRAAPLAGPEGAGDDNPGTSRDHAVYRDRLVVEPPHPPEVTGDRADLGDELVLVIVPADREDLAPVPRTQIAHDMPQPLLGDLGCRDGHFTTPSWRLKWTAARSAGPGAWCSNWTPKCVP